MNIKEKNMMSVWKICSNLGTAVWSSACPGGLKGWMVVYPKRESLSHEMQERTNSWVDFFLEDQTID